LSQEKGVKTLLKAHAGMDKKYPLKIVGTGPLEDVLKQEFSAVEFWGYKSGGELNELIRNAAFVVVPSECYENCSMVVLEAMAFGKPIIGSRIGGIPEQVEDNKNGFLFEMGNVEQLARKMGVLAEDKVLRKEMGQAGREKLEREYSLQDHCAGLLDIYSELLGRDVRKDVPERVQ
jgi:glycosyltransferase involved in cell wall biosynthesis